MAKTKKQIKREKVLNKFFEAKMSLEVLTQEIKDMKEEVVKVLLGAPDQEAVTQDALFTLRRSTKYEYSKKVALKNEEISMHKETLKNMKKDEEKSGEAEVVSESFIPVVRMD